MWIARASADAKAAQQRQQAELKAARDELAAVRSQLEAELRAKDADAEAMTRKIVVRGASARMHSHMGG